MPASVGHLAVGNLARIFVVDSDDRCVIDLRHARFVEPVGLVAVAATVDRALQDGLEVTVTAPENLDCNRYLARMRLGTFLDGLGVEHGLAAMQQHDVDNLCELRWFGNEGELERAAAVIVEQYRRAGAAVVEPLYNALFELGQNAVDHSGQEGGYVAVQTFPRREDVAFAVADAGVGLRARIGGATDAEAIARAARKYESSASGQGRGRGRGITGVVELTNKHPGLVSFFTGAAQGDFTNGHWNPRVSVLAAPFLGTLVNTRLSQRGDR